MATVIRVRIANGYRPQVDAFAEAHPNLTRDEAAKRWVDERYGGWITANITETFGFEKVSAQEFDVRFAHEDHACRFQDAIGGQEVTDGF